MSEFTGTFSGSFDAKKGRVSVPAPFRAILSRYGADEIILRKTPKKPSIEVWPAADFLADVNAKAAGHNRISPEYKAIMSKLTISIHRLHPDTEGRVVMPRDLVGQLKLDGELVFVGFMAYFEIWSAADFAVEKARLEAEEDA